MFLQSVKIILWVLGEGKKASKGDLINRTGVGWVLLMVLSFSILLVYDFLTNNSLMNYNIWLIPTICIVPGFVIFAAGCLYEFYLMEVKGDC